MKRLYLRNVDNIIDSVSSADLAKVVKHFIKSSKFDAEERRRFLNELKEYAKPAPELVIYPGLAWSQAQYSYIERSKWADFVPALLEIAADHRGDLNNIIYNLDVFLAGQGVEELMRMDRTPFLKGIITALLLLGGYEFKMVRRPQGGSHRLLSHVKGTELLTIENRIDIAMARCDRLKLITGE